MNERYYGWWPDPLCATLATFLMIMVTDAPPTIGGLIACWVLFYVLNQLTRTD